MTAIFTAAPYFVGRFSFLVIRQSLMRIGNSNLICHPTALYCPPGAGVNRVTVRAGLRFHFLSFVEQDAGKHGSHCGP
jgi:hypothetical protein